MTRVLLIDADRAFAQSVAMACLQRNVAIRLAETLCDGVRCLLDDPVSLVLIDAALMRLSAAEQIRLFQLVAPGVPVSVLVDPGASLDETVKLEMQGFHVTMKPFEIDDVLAKIERVSHPMPSPPGAASRVHAVCS